MPDVKAIAAIRQFIGRRFRLKLKRNYQVCKFDFVKKSGQTIGRPIDFMGFVFFRTRTVIRESIMLSASRLAVKMHKAKDAGRGFLFAVIKERHVIHVPFIFPDAQLLRSVQGSTRHGT